MAKRIQVKKICFLYFYLLIIIFSLVSCSSNRFNNLSAKTYNLIQNAVFEVVIEKPTDDPITYDRKLNWENVPYAIRTDNYSSIGTAFAISKTELISAFHVFEMNPSINYLIRDSKGYVYEVDQIISGCNEKDILIFTVKEKIFNNFFQLENSYRIGDPVFSVGNALGEGIIIRNGFILGTVPEDDSGRWNLLKSSADGSPGNSGGPLITSNGKVVALVTARKDNILYSIPADVITNNSRLFLNYRIKSFLNHPVLPKNINYYFRPQVRLPASFIETTNIIIEDHKKHYKAEIFEYFDMAHKYLKDTNYFQFINNLIFLTFPQYGYFDFIDNNWKITRMTNQIHNLKEDGRLMHSSRSGFNFYRIIKPRSVPLEKINTDPMYIMDLILSNIKTERILWGRSRDINSDKYRILSYGNPVSIGEYHDNHGRKWITAYWNIAFNSNVIIMYILPHPNGPVLITTKGSSAYKYEHEIDIQKLCEHTFIAYEATFAEWVEFFEFQDFVPAFLKDISFDWDSNEQRFSFKSDSISINPDNQSLNWTNDSKLFLFPFWYKNNFKSDTETNFSLYFSVKDPITEENVIEQFNDLIQVLITR